MNGKGVQRWSKPEDLPISIVLSFREIKLRNTGKINLISATIEIRFLIY